MDIIGDIHGHADELVLLLEKMGYFRGDSGTYQYPNNARKVVFVGDLIDRGPKIRETLMLVKSMVDNGTAHCIRGNHEDNAIKFWTLSNPNSSPNNQGYLRKHTIKNIIQHSATIKAFQNRENEWEMYLNWFKGLPYFLNFKDVRIIHASWHQALNNPFFDITADSQVQGIILHGEELKLPPGSSFADKDGHVRSSGRTQWWLNPQGLTYRQYLETYAMDIAGLDIPISDEILKTLGSGYPINEKPIFFGHYWLRGEPKIQADNVCCLDYSVAKGGNLVAYRFDGEQKLNNNKFVIV
jgi:hypothetical protein